MRSWAHRGARRVVFGSNRSRAAAPVPGVAACGLAMVVGLAGSAQPVGAGANPDFTFPLHAKVASFETCDGYQPVDCATLRPTVNVPANTDIVVFLLLFNYDNVVGAQTAFEWDAGWTLIDSFWNCLPNQMAGATPAEPGGANAGTIATAFDCVTGPAIRAVGRLHFLSGPTGCLGQVESSYPNGTHVIDCAMGIDRLDLSDPVHRRRVGRICVDQGGFGGCSTNRAEETIALALGWNIMSFNVATDQQDLLDIVSPILPQLSRIVDERGNALFYNQFGQIWVNNIGNARVWDGYYTRMTASTSLTLEGDVVELPITDSLTVGWNIIGYPYYVEHDAMQVLDPLVSGGVLVKGLDEAGRAIFYDPFNQRWVNNIGNMRPGEGYYLNVNRACQMVFVEVPPRHLARLDDLSAARRPRGGPGMRRCPQHFQMAQEGNPYRPMLVNLLGITRPGTDLQAGDEVGVFDGELCVGAAVVDRVVDHENLLSIAASADDPQTSHTDGFVTGHPLELRIWDSRAESEHVAEADCWEAPGAPAEGVFEPLGFLYVDARVDQTATAREAAPRLGWGLGRSCPNPLSEEAAIDFLLPESGGLVRLTVHDVSGHLVRELLHERLPAGPHRIAWDGREDGGWPVASGIYFLRMKTSSLTETRKIIVTR